MVKAPQDHKTSSKKPVIRTVKICNDSELADEFYEKLDRLNMLKLQAAMTESGQAEMSQGLKDEMELLEREVKELEARVKEASLTFKFRSIGRKAYNKLKEEHQPTDVDKEIVRKDGQNPDELLWSPPTFFPALVLASCFESPDSVDLETVFDDPDWNDAELGELSQAALDANTTRRVVPLGKG